MARRPNFRERREQEWSSTFDQICLTRAPALLEESVVTGLLSLLGLGAHDARDYQHFLRTRNGGIPEPNRFLWTHPTAGERVSRVAEFYCLTGDLLAPRSPGALDLIAATLEHRFDLPRYAVPVGYTSDEFGQFEGLLLVFGGFEREGQVWIQLTDELPWYSSDPENPSAGLYVIAKSFADFISKLATTQGSGERS